MRRIAKLLGQQFDEDEYFQKKSPPKRQPQRGNPDPNLKVPFPPDNSLGVYKEVGPLLDPAIRHIMRVPMFRNGELISLD